MAESHEHELAREMMRRGYSRRDILKFGLRLGLSAAGLSALLSACGQTPQPQTSEGQAAAGTTTSQTPSTAAEASPAGLYAEADAEGLTWPQSGVAEPSGPVEISVAHAWDATFLERQVQFDRQFMARHPNITVKSENTPWGDFLQKYLAQIAGGSAPDLMYVHFSWAQQLISQGSVRELDTYISQASELKLDDFTKPSLVSYRREGKLYGIPYDEGPGILYYNKDIFDKAGVSYPDNSWTLDTLKETALKLTSGSGPNKIYGLGGLPSAGDALMAPAYLFPFGARYVNEPEETECLLTSPEAVQAMEWWNEFREKGAVPSPADLETLSWPPFQHGRIAMVLEGTWATPPIQQNAKFPWDVAPWPKGPQAHSTYSAGSSYMMPSTSKNQDAAWIYLNEYLSSSGQIFMWASTGRGSPSRTSAWDAYLTSKFAPANAEVALEALNNYASHDILDQPSAAKVTQKAGAIWDLVVNNQLSVADALNQVCAEIEPILKENAA